jgi:hypothetical protein
MQEVLMCCSFCQCNTEETGAGAAHLAAHAMNGEPRRSCVYYELCLYA